MKVSIIGATGYGGLELIRYLVNHPHVEIISIHSQTETQAVDQQYPHLKGILSMKLTAVDPEEIMNQSDLVFLASPSGISKKLALPFIENDFPVIDLSGDFRLKEAGAYEKWYGTDAQHFSSIEKFDYGLAEFRENLNSKFIANPGCYATASELSLAPLLQNQLAELDSIVIDGKSGLSGAGKGMSASSHFSHVNENMSVYKMNKHQHIPEIVQQFQHWAPELKGIQFTTSLIPVTRGILVTAYVKLKDVLSCVQLVNLYKSCYMEKPFIRIQEEGCFPCIKQVAGTNFCDIGLAVNKEMKMATIVTVIDNLGKGAAGQAIQNMNLFAGFSETDGLMQVPIYP
ncbi:N-acetyl-gamma-glutamyl-phosphate reductase [Enterococcus sp. BWB1-3]|uniref:N-acetyl-gamma-glutamyl-phosphate reductase n=1 Tax=Enterococcus sp. BWB1-3 TaxID=2787713 RepID=UPI001924FAC7|nr:N-acetyl-gamma-glutamyl-phosphate reductase [Enterococcus sp. BWB1-3]MBL1230117.1 N-acetyl-gamma-glutamyl-phosphate reductase [Enterococcus sp. BWB1-3]